VKIKLRLKDLRKSNVLLNVASEKIRNVTGVVLTRRDSIISRRTSTRQRTNSYEMSLF